MTGLIIEYATGAINDKTKKNVLKKAIALSFATVPRKIGGGLSGAPEQLIFSDVLFIADIETGAVMQIDPTQLMFVDLACFGIEQTQGKTFTQETTKIIPLTPKN